MQMMHESALPSSNSMDSPSSHLPSGLHSLAEKAHPTVKDAFPSSQYTTVGYLASVIFALEGRLVNIKDIPTLAPFFFIEPDLGSEEARSMMKKVDQVIARKCLTHSLATSLSTLRIPHQLDHRSSPRRSTFSPRTNRRKLDKRYRSLSDLT